MGIFDIMKNHEPVEPEEDTTPKIVQKKIYTICTENNPDRSEYAGCGKKYLMVPDCKLTLVLDGLASEEMRTLEAEITDLLDEYGFTIR
jgi:hypothetical protein